MARVIRRVGGGWVPRHRLAAVFGGAIVLASSLLGVAFLLLGDAAASSFVEYSQVQAVSCVPGGSCTAIGVATDLDGRSHPIALVQAPGGSWQPGLELALPGDAAPNPETAMADISCPATGDCTAIGTYVSQGGYTEIVAFTEIGGSWGAGVAVPLPANAVGISSYPGPKLSCSSAGNCAAVADYWDSSGNGDGLLLSESNGTWAPGTEATLPAGASTTSRYVDLNSISCPANGECAVVGDYLDNNQVQQRLLITENGGAWSPGTAPQLPSGADASYYSSLTSVSCSSVGNCAAGGTYSDTAGNQNAFVINQTSGAWSAPATLSLPAGAVFYGLSGLSCWSGGNCEATGSLMDARYEVLPFATRETNDIWSTAAELPLPADAMGGGNQYAEVQSLQCISTGDCVAGGWYYDTSSNLVPLVVTQSNGAWTAPSAVQLPSNAVSTSQQAGITSVGCSSAGNCAAVGDYNQYYNVYTGQNTGVFPVGLIYSETNGTWAAPFAPTIAGLMSPTAVTATNAGAGTVNLSWNAPTSDVDFALTGYLVVARDLTNSAGDATVDITSGTTTTTTLAHLRVGDTYTFTVVAFTDLAYSGWAATSDPLVVSSTTTTQPTTTQPSTAQSTPTQSTLPQSTSTQSTPIQTASAVGAGTARVASASGSTARETLNCSGGGSQSCEFTETLTVTKRVKHGKKTRKVKVVVGSGKVTLAGGQSKTVKITLNGAGRALLKAHGKLSVSLTVKQGARTIRSQRLTFHRSSKRRG